MNKSRASKEASYKSEAIKENKEEEKSEEEQSCSFTQTKIYNTESYYEEKEKSDQSDINEEIKKQNDIVHNLMLLQENLPIKKTSNQSHPASMLDSIISKRNSIKALIEKGTNPEIVYY